MLSVQQLLEQKPKGIYSVQPDDPVITAIRKMAEHHIGALLVMTGDRLVGIVSERDYARKVVLLGRSSTETRVSDIMTPKVITVTPKHGGKPYEIIPANAGRDPAPGAGQGAAGQRVWNVLDF